MDILIIGAGGHGQVAADTLLAMERAGQPVRPMGFLDDDPALRGQKFQGLPVLGTVAELCDTVHQGVILGIGSNRTRAKLFAELSERGETFVTAIHPTAVVSPSASVGAGTLVCAGAIVNPLAEIRDNCILNTGCIVEHHGKIGPHAHLAPGVRMGGECVVDEGVLMGVGANVAPRTRLGAWSTVGVGAAVVRDVPAGITVAGVPAKPLK